MTDHPAPELPDINRAADLPEHLGEHLSYGDAAGDNAIRAGFAATGVKAYAERTGVLDSEDAELAVGDLLADLMHLCDALGLEFELMVEKATRHYLPELSGDL